MDCKRSILNESGDGGERRSSNEQNGSDSQPRLSTANSYQVSEGDSSKCVNDSSSSSDERPSEDASDSSAISTAKTNTKNGGDDLNMLPPRPGTSTDKSKLRKGKWTAEEEEYTSRIIHYFNSGLLTLPDGATLRSYLAEKLNCDPMRITKKYAGASCLGRRIQHFRERTQPSLAEIQLAQAELDLLERRFRLRVEEGCTGIPLPKPELMAPIAAASAPGMMLPGALPMPSPTNQASTVPSQFQSWLLSLAATNPSAPISTFCSPLTVPTLPPGISPHLLSMLLQNIPNPSLANTHALQAESAIASLAFAQASAAWRAAANPPPPNVSALLLQNLQKATSPSPSALPQPSPPSLPAVTEQTLQQHAVQQQQEVLEQQKQKQQQSSLGARPFNPEAYMEQLKNAYQEHLKASNIQVEESRDVKNHATNPSSNESDQKKNAVKSHPTQKRESYPTSLENPAERNKRSNTISPTTTSQVQKVSASKNKKKDKDVRNRVAEKMESTNATAVQYASQNFHDLTCSKLYSHVAENPLNSESARTNSQFASIQFDGESQRNLTPPLNTKSPVRADNEDTLRPTDKRETQECEENRTEEEKAAGNILIGFLSSLRDSYEEALTTKEVSPEKQGKSKQKRVRANHVAKGESRGPQASSIRFENERIANVTDASPSPPQSSLEDSEDWNSDKKNDPSSSEDSDKDDKEARHKKFDKKLPSGDEETSYNNDKGQPRIFSSSKGPPRKRLKAARAMSDGSTRPKN